MLLYSLTIVNEPVGLHAPIYSVNKGEVTEDIRGVRKSPHQSRPKAHTWGIISLGIHQTPFIPSCHSSSRLDL